MLPMLVYLSLGATAEPMVYHISPSGDDGGPGTWERPWRTVDKVNGVSLRPGDRVLFEGGQTFAGTLLFDAEDSGTESQRVVVSSYGEGRATIDGGLGTAIRADRCDYLDVTNINVRGAGRKNDNSGSGVHVTQSTGIRIADVEAQGFRLYGVVAEGVRDARITGVYAHDNGAGGINVGNEAAWSEDVYIAHCVAENNPGDPKNLDNHSGNGIVAGCVRRCTIEYCEAMNNGWDMPREGNGPVGIWAWNADRVVIQFCVSHDNKSPGGDGGGFDLDGGVTNSIMQYNLSYGNVGPGYLLCTFPYAMPWKNNIVRYNISQNDGKPGQFAGIRIYWLEGMSDAEIYNNTVYNEKGSAVDLYGDQMPGMRFRNNIFISGTALITGGAHKARFEGNSYWLLDGKPFEVDGYSSLEAWSEATGQERIDGKLMGMWGDPKVVRPGLATLTNPQALGALAEYRLMPGSRCIGAGLPIEDSDGRDLWGAPVRAYARPSIGACEKPQAAADENQS